jgi:signal transduction histidine kinase
MLDGYASLAALGHAASLLGRSVHSGISGLRERVSSLRTALGKKVPADSGALTTSVAELEGMLDLVAAQLSSVASAGSGGARRRRGLDIAVELRRVRDDLQSILAMEDAELDVQAQDDVPLRTEMRPEMLTSLVSVLVRNSLEWRLTDRPLRMIAAARVSGESLEVMFSDNGRGVVATLEENLFEPGVSGNDGAGMGLTIARNVVTAHGGTMSLLTDRRRKGATFLITLPRKRSRATTSPDS